MKKLNLFSAALIGVAAFLVTSCADPCKDVTCENGGTCNDEGICECADNFFGDACAVECVNGTYGAACDCDEGYEGDACKIESSEKFLASYNVSDDCVSSDYTSSITASSTDGYTNILISNFGNYVCNGEAPTVQASVDGNDLTIAEQTFCDGNEFTIEGTGSMNESGKVITINYSGVDNAGATYNCTATLTKQ